MKVLVIGSGGREHALSWAISKRRLLTKLYCAPGNGGMAGVGTVLYALANGPLVQWFMARFEIAPKGEVSPAPST